MDLPFGMMFFCKTDHVFDLNLLAVVGNRKAVVTPEHLVDQAGDDSQIGLRGAVFEGREGQVETTFGVGEFPRLHVVARDIIELDLLQLVDAVV